MITELYTAENAVLLLDGELRDVHSVVAEVTPTGLSINVQGLDARVYRRLNSTVIISVPGYLRAKCLVTAYQATLGVVTLRSVGQYSLRA